MPKKRRKAEQTTGNKKKREKKKKKKKKKTHKKNIQTIPAFAAAAFRERRSLCETTQKQPNKTKQKQNKNKTTKKKFFFSSTLPHQRTQNSKAKLEKKAWHTREDPQTSKQAGIFLINLIFKPRFSLYFAIQFISMHSHVKQAFHEVTTPIPSGPPFDSGNIFF